MKIAIQTCWEPDDNYGTQIQCFALQYYLRELGHEAYLVRYKRFGDRNPENTPKQWILKATNPFRIIRKLKSIYINTWQRIDTKIHDRGSREFRNEYLLQSRIYNNYQELVDDPPDADLYIVGSDQVWNISYKQKNNLNAFFLNYGSKETTRISFAASFGFESEDLCIEYASIVEPMLKRFSGVSVREKEGIEICRRLGVVDAIQVCDPVFLLSTKQYKSIMDSTPVKIEKKRYVFVYNIVADSNLDINSIRDWARENNFDVIYVTGHGRLGGKPKINATIAEWIMYISDAECVVTNSFHGTAISLLFHKQVVAFRLKGIAESSNSRFDVLNFLAGKNIVAREREEYKKLIKQEIDWELFENRKSTLRDTGVNYLSKYII